jgi:hypothetical protein
MKLMSFIDCLKISGGIPYINSDSNSATIYLTDEYDFVSYSKWGTEFDISYNGGVLFCDDKTCYRNKSNETFSVDTGFNYLGSRVVKITKN